MKYYSFVFYVNGDKRITDISTNDGQWHLVCSTWESEEGNWAIYVDGYMEDWGSGLAEGTVIDGKIS